MHAMSLSQSTVWSWSNRHRLYSSNVMPIFSQSNGHAGLNRACLHKTSEKDVIAKLLQSPAFSGQMALRTSMSLMRVLH